MHSKRAHHTEDCNEEANEQDDLWESADGGTHIYPTLLPLSLPLQNMWMGRDGSREQLKNGKALCMKA